MVVCAAFSTRFDVINVLRFDELAGEPTGSTERFKH